MDRFLGFRPGMAAVWLVLLLGLSGMPVTVFAIPEFLDCRELDHCSFSYDPELSPPWPGGFSRPFIITYISNISSSRTVTFEWEFKSFHPGGEFLAVQVPGNHAGVVERWPFYDTPEEKILAEGRHESEESRSIELTQDGTFSFCVVNVAKYNALCESVTVTSAPESLNYVEGDSDGTHTFSWPASVGATRYELQRRVEGDDDWTEVYAGDQETFNENDLPSGTYQHRIRACTPDMCSPYHQLAVTLSVPISIHVPNSVLGSSVIISWDESFGASRYELQQQRDGGAWQDVYVGAATSARVASLVLESSYYFRVRACNRSCSSYKEGGPLILDPTVAIRKQLYYNEADAVPEDIPGKGVYSRDLAAFRYLDLSYVLDPSTGQPIYDVGNGNEDQDFSLLYGAAERVRAGEVLSFTENLLTESLSEVLRIDVEKLLLNIYYDRAVAEVIIANQKLDQARKIRLNEGGISAEI